MRHLALGQPALRELNDLRGPMSLVLDFFVKQQQELSRYKQMYGELPPEDGIDDGGKQLAITSAEEADGKP